MLKVLKVQKGCLVYKEIGQIHWPCQQKTTSGNSSHDPADPADPAEVVSASAARNLLSTRAGGQDDVSSQANSLKLAFRLFWAPR